MTSKLEKKKTKKLKPEIKYTLLIGFIGSIVSSLSKMFEILLQNHSNYLGLETTIVVWVLLLLILLVGVVAFIWKL